MESDELTGGPINHEDEDYSGQVLDGHYVQHNFIRCNFNGAVLSGVFEWCVFDNCESSGFTMSGSFSHCNLGGLFKRRDR